MTSISNIAKHIKAIDDRISNEIEPEYVKNYRKAQLLQAQGMFELSLVHLQEAMVGVKPLRSEYVWERLYLSVGALLAGTLDYFGKHEEAEGLYIELLEANPTGDYICDYAIFLHRRKRDYDQAEIVFVKALALHPKHSSLHLKYAGFLRHARHDLEGAKKHYETAIEVNPMNADAVGSYASFLHGVIGNMEDASTYYQQAIALDLTNANNLCNYGLFLSEVKDLYEEAEKLYKQALAITPNHVNTLYNYGVMLDTHCRRKDEAEMLYRGALDEEPKHPFALYNLAVLLEEKLPPSLTSLAKPPENTPIALVGAIPKAGLDYQSSRSGQIPLDYDYEVKGLNSPTKASNPVSTGVRDSPTSSSRPKSGIENENGKNRRLSMNDGIRSEEISEKDSNVHGGGGEDDNAVDANGDIIRLTRPGKMVKAKSILNDGNGVDEILTPDKIPGGGSANTGRRGSLTLKPIPVSTDLNRRKSISAIGVLTDGDMNDQADLIRGDLLPKLTIDTDDVSHIKGEEEWRTDVNLENERALAEVTALYERAMEADPTDAGTAADFGRFLWNKTGDVEKAQEVLTKALTLSEGTNEVALYNIASLFHKHKGDLQSSGNALYRLTKLNGSHTGGLQQLGRVLIDTFKQRPILSEEEEEAQMDKPNLREAMDYYEKAIALVPDPSNIIIEYLKEINEHGDVREKVRALATAGVILKLKGASMARKNEVEQLLKHLKQLNDGRRQSLNN